MKLLRFTTLCAVALAWTMLPAAADDAAKLYETKCASCHGADGKGVEAKTKSLKVEMAALDLVDKDSLAKGSDQWIKIITNGEKKMPKYTGKIPDADIAALDKYVRGMAK